MYTGWRKNLRFFLDRQLTTEEKSDALPRSAASDSSFDERGGLIALNSTYIEWIDRRFRARGSGSTVLATLIVLGFGGVTVGMVIHAVRMYQNPAEFWGSLMVVAGCALGVGLFYWLQFSIDFFQKVYYPIRFNRKNRMIYVYRDKRDGGILRVSWDKVYFHIGQGMMNPQLYDIRGEVLEGNTIKDTFAVGNYYPGHADYVKQAWAFICRYMEDGPEAVGPDPRDRYIETSLHGTWRDCLMMAYLMYGAPNTLIRVISIPFIAASTVTRWLVFKTCRMPQWPDDIETACKVDSNDPNIWPQPKYMDQFSREVPGVMDRLNERRSASFYRARGENPLADEMAKWQAGIRKNPDKDE